MEVNMVIVDAQIHLWNAGKPTNANQRHLGRKL